MPKNLYEAVTSWMYHQARKHNFDGDYVERQVNGMSQYEFLVALSEGLECMTPAHVDAIDTDDDNLVS